VQFQGLGGLRKTKFLEGDVPSAPWLKWMNLLPVRLSSPVTSDAPATSTATGVQGEIRQDANFLYVCVSTNTWRRIALSAF
jgi:hypothetical protein